MKFKTKLNVSNLKNVRNMRANLSILRNLKLRFKLLLMNAIAILFLLIVGITGYFYMDKMSSNSTRMYEESLLSVKWINQLKSNFNETEANLLEMMLSTDVKYKVKLKVKLDENSAKNKELVTKIAGIALNQEETDAFKSFEELNLKYRDVIVRTIEHATQNNQVAYQVYNNEVSPQGDKTIEALDKLVLLKEFAAEQFQRSSSADSKTSHWVIILTIVIAIIVMTANALALNMIITTPIRRLQEHMEKAASGDLSVKGDYPYEDEVGKLTGSFNVMTESLRSLVKQIAENALTLSASSEELLASSEQSSLAAKQVATSSQKLSEDFDKQFAGVNQANEAVQQMLTSTKLIDESAQEVAELAEQATQAAQHGKQSVVSIAGQMTEISDAVREVNNVIEALGKNAYKIGEIVNVINEISTQTNLLSLNAAIEAARAGEAGRGFAVVAGEVRKLAEQSSSSARNITELVSTIQRQINHAVSSMHAGAGKVEVGLSISGKAQESFVHIESSVEKVNAKVESVNLNIHQLVDANLRIEQVMGIVSAVSETGISVSQETSAASQQQMSTTEEIENSAKSLAGLAEELQISLQKFTV
ncbi:methyl-accepting chemotaxis protein [Paenibacillus frigoriresistens]|uniref:methyl-accepting chemotaxis protein n=1 Tax=Paenibacillus alginolyticus TaxID=59839 RepID=UPI0015649330|nr:methyl-accepting chemotaxis protein [Paenibacillus frigoriresistens]NRF91344.1 methyl-accepting chemotaxis protein [Paenibacillus frigoriresistens]